MEHAQCADDTRVLASPSSSTIIPPSAAPSSTSIPIASAASGKSGSASIAYRIRITEQAFQYERRAETIHNLCFASRFGAWCNLLATTGNCRGYMCGVQRGRLGEERYFLVVPVDEDTPRCGEDVGDATLQGKNDFLKFGGEKRRRTLRRPVLSASIVKNSGVEENIGKSYIFISLSVCVRARISSTGDNPEMKTRRGEGEYAHPPTEIESSTSSGLITFRRSTDDSSWP